MARGSPTRRLLRRTARRVYSAALRLSWQLDITVLLDAEVIGDDRDSVARLTQQYLLRRATHIVVVTPAGAPTGWRDLAITPITGLREMTVDDNDDRDVGWPRTVATVATIRIVLPARHADADLYAHVDPLPGIDRAICRIDAAVDAVTRTPVRHRGKHR